jgi:hypothetical protein
LALDRWLADPCSRRRSAGSAPAWSKSSRSPRIPAAA